MKTKWLVASTPCIAKPGLIRTQAGFSFFRRRVECLSLLVVGSGTDSRLSHISPWDLHQMV